MTKQEQKLKISRRLQFVLGVTMVTIALVVALWLLGGWRAFIGLAIALGAVGWIGAGLFLMYRGASERRRNDEEA